MALEYGTNDTIAAVATALSESGIGIIRISGPDAGIVTEKVFRTKNGVPVRSWKANTIHYGQIIDPDSEEMLDEVLVSWMKAPHSYTTEDTSEINTHGGILVMQRVLDAVFRAGARPAEPGEFTKRAFLNGRIDLSEAEAVMDLIQAQSDFSRRTALSQMRGALSGKIRRMRDIILHETAFIESALDDPDNYSLEGYPDTLEIICRDLIYELDDMLARSEQGQILRDGIRTTIVGRPNVGKSSVLNMLAGREKAIVTDIPGTTRDVVEADIELHCSSNHEIKGAACGNKVLLRLTDTAGIRETDDTVEKIGVDRARQEMESAQLILFVVDGSQHLLKEDSRIAGMIRQQRLRGAECLLAVNKKDLARGFSDEELNGLCDMLSQDGMSRFDGRNIIYLSCLKEEGLSELSNRIGEMFHAGSLIHSEEPMVVGERHKAELRNARKSLELTLNSVQNRMSEDLYAIDLMDAYTALGRIIGEAVDDDLVDKIFSEFCLGK